MRKQTEAERAEGKEKTAITKEPEKPENPEKAESTESIESTERTENTELTEHTERTEHTELTENTERTEHTENTERTGKTEETVYEDESFLVFRYHPRFLRPFCPVLEKMPFSTSLRLEMERFYGRRVYYLVNKQKRKTIGFCSVVEGSLPRYRAFAGNKDIIFGRYFIRQEERGRGYAKKLLRIVLNEAEKEYRNAFAYLRKENLISRKTLESLGTTSLGTVRMKGIARKLCLAPEGEFLLVRYEQS